MIINETRLTLQEKYNKAINSHCVKCRQLKFFWSVFFRIRTVSLHIQCECWKIWTRKSSNPAFFTRSAKVVDTTLLYICPQQFYFSFIPKKLDILILIIYVWKVSQSDCLGSNFPFLTFAYMPTIDKMNFLDADFEKKWRVYIKSVFKVNLQWVRYHALK